MLGLAGDPGDLLFLIQLERLGWTDSKGFGAWRRIYQYKPLISITATELVMIFESYEDYLQDIEVRILEGFSSWQSGENVHYN
jgi:hypothetical protein